MAGLAVTNCGKWVVVVDAVLVDAVLVDAVVVGVGVEGVGVEGTVGGGGGGGGGGGVWLGCLDWWWCTAFRNCSISYGMPLKTLSSSAGVNIFMSNTVSRVTTVLDRLSLPVGCSIQPP